MGSARWSFDDRDHTASEIRKPEVEGNECLAVWL